MDRYKELCRLIGNIKSGKFNHKRYRKRRKYYGLELHTDTEYAVGGFGLSVYDGDTFLWWIFKHDNFQMLNISGRPHDEVLERMKSNPNYEP